MDGLEGSREGAASDAYRVQQWKNLGDPQQAPDNRSSSGKNTPENRKSGVRNSVK